MEHADILIGPSGETLCVESGSEKPDPKKQVVDSARQAARAILDKYSKKNKQKTIDQKETLRRQERGREMIDSSRRQEKRKRRFGL